MLDEGIQKHLDKLEQDLLGVKYVTKVDYDLTSYQDGINAPIILVDYDIPFDIEVGQWFKEKNKLKNIIIKTIEDNGVKVEKEEFEDNDTYFYIVSYHTNWEQKDKTEESKKEEAKFKDKVKAIKKSLKKNDRRLSDETAQKSAERIAGSMIKKEESENFEELEVLANDIIDFMGADMGTWFDEIQGNEEEIFYNTLSILESKDKEQIQILMNNIAEAEIDEETAKEIGIKSSNNLIERINKIIVDKKEESLENGWKPAIDLYTRQINEISDNLGISKNEIQKEGDSIKFRYNGKVYFAEPRAMYQVDIFDDNHNQIGWGVLTDNIKEEVFTDYITDNKFIYELVGGDKAGKYTKEQLDSLDIINGCTDENPGRRDELKNQPTLKGYLGPMWNGIEDGKAVIRYETQEVYDMLSESNNLNENKTEDYWDAKELTRDGFTALLKFNFGVDKDGNNYMITKDAYNIKRFYAKNDEDALDFYYKWKNAERNAFGDYILEEVKQYKFDGTEIFPKRIKARGGYVFTKVNDGTKENDFVPVYINDSGSETLMFQDDFNRCEILEEAEIVDRPEDILEAEEGVESKSTEDAIDNKEESETILDLLQDRIGQQIEVGRLNAILQSVFGMYNKTFILPTDLYNMDLNETQELTVFDDEDEYTIYFDIIDIDNGIIEITGVDLL